MNLNKITFLLTSLVAFPLSLSAAVIDVNSVYVRDDGTPVTIAVTEEEGFLWFSAPKQALRFGKTPVANYGMVHGGGVGEASLAFGHRAMAGGYASFAAGGSRFPQQQDDPPDIETTYALGDFSFGFGYNVHSKADFGFAFGSSVNVRPTAIGAENFADSSYIDAVAASAFGAHHYIYETAGHSAVFGEGNHVSGSHSLVAGQNNEIQTGHSYSMLAGFNLIATASYQSLFGVRSACLPSHQGYALSTSTQGQSYVATPIFAVGNGGMIFDGQSAPWFNNAFTIYNDGSATVDGNLYVNGRNGLGQGTVHAKTVEVVNASFSGTVDISRVEPKGGISMGAFN